MHGCKFEPINSLPHQVGVALLSHFPCATIPPPPAMPPSHDVTAA